MYIMTRLSLTSVLMPSVRHSPIAVISPPCLLSVAMLIFAVHYDVAQAKNRAAVASACGKELQKQCTGVPVLANNMLECLQKAKLSRRCAALAHNIVRMCDREAVQLCQGVVAGQGNILGCLTAAGGQFPRNAMRLLMRLTSASEQE